MLIVFVHMMGKLARLTVKPFGFTVTLPGDENDLMSVKVEVAFNSVLRLFMMMSLQGNEAHLENVTT